MESKCSVCNQGGGYVVCDGCGKEVCFNCFRFLNSRKLCGSCVAESEKKLRWQAYAQQCARMAPDERAGFWATLSPEEQSMLEGQLPAPGEVPVHRVGAIRKYSWLVFPIVGCLVVVLLFTDKQLWRKASVASKKLGAEVGSLAGSVKREVVDLTSPGSSPAPAVAPAQTGAIELVGQNLRRNGLPITASNLRMKDNPDGEGKIVYSPHYFGPNRRLAWIVIDGSAYSLTQAAREATPSLRTTRAVPPSLWKKTGLPREEALSQLQTSLWD